ncbi:MAG TPA: PD-(D/E)XK nuclease family protein [Anaerolineae bacterium]|nr:PD-(D/E)XK nuclease family protein [Anaerolineae bacterium]
MLPETFQFTQGKLQDYADCARRFQLRHVLMQPWPALITESPGALEQQMQRGADLHRLARQHASGIDPQRLEQTIHDETLFRWWQVFLAHPPSSLPQAVRRAEVVLAAPFAGYRLVARIDLLAADPGQRLVVVDWKTVHNPPPRATLALRLQTRVYRLLAVEAGDAFNKNVRPRPEQVEMIYWFAVQGGVTQRFPYDSEQHTADREYLAGLIREIATEQSSIWPLTPEERHCRLCKYRSLCERGVKPGFLEDLEDDIEPPDITIDLEQIAEVQF